MLSFIKSSFKKELNSILAPLEKIHGELDNFINTVSLDISENIKKISLIQAENEAKKVEQETANVVKQSLKNLLGKL